MQLVSHPSSILSTFSAVLLKVDPLISAKAGKCYPWLRLPRTVGMFWEVLWCKAMMKKPILLGGGGGEGIYSFHLKCLIISLQLFTPSLFYHPCRALLWGTGQFYKQPDLSPVIAVMCLAAF